MLKEDPQAGVLAPASKLGFIEAEHLVLWDN
jgi:hypothetical protein